MNLSFYTVDSAFCDYLRRFDRHVPYTMDKKSTRPFIGILLTVHNYTYYAPLSSPKPKHLKMKNHIDFIKINNGTWGAINLNNMIPILKQFVEKVDPNNLNRSYDDVAYKNLLNNQLSWCNSHKDNILSKAQKLYNTITHETAHDNLRERCCDFIKLEAVLEHYIDS